MSGEVGILNVGAGDTKISFDPKNPQDRIRAARIVKDMIRHGYALLIEVNGETRRAYDFDENACEYIIADFDPSMAQETDNTHEQTPAAKPEETRAAPRGKGGRPKRVPAESVTGTAVARTSGG